MKALALFFVLITAVPLAAQVKVKGYYRSDGTYVRPHYRSSPDGNPYNNWSYPGNTNPYTGKTAGGDSDTYLDNYYDRSSRTSNSTRNTYPAATYSNSRSDNLLKPLAHDNHYVTVHSLNVRSGPSTNYAIVGSLSYAANVRVVESYSNGWRKIEYTVFDFRSHSFGKNTGYVSGSYLSASHPYLSNSYNPPSANSLRYEPNNTYSTFNSTDSPHGYGNGGITVWTNCGTDGEIKVYLNGNYIGKLNKYFEETPDCGQMGTLSVNKPAGTYNLEARGTQKTWKGSITITEDKCLIQGLNK